MTSTAAAASRVPDPVFGFNDRLRKARLLHGSTQRDFADQLGVKHPTYAAWELGTTTCPRETAIAKRIEVLTGVRAVWLLGLDEPTPPLDGGPISAPTTEATMRRYTAGDELAIRRSSRSPGCEPVMPASARMVAA